MNADLADPDFIYVWIAFAAMGAGLGALAWSAVTRLAKWRRAAQEADVAAPKS